MKIILFNFFIKIPETNICHFINCLKQQLKLFQNTKEIKSTTVCFFVLTKEFCK